MKQRFINSRVEKRIKDLEWDRTMFYMMTNIGELPHNAQSRYTDEEWDERISYAAYLLNCSKDYLTNSNHTDIGSPIVVSSMTCEDMFDYSEYIETIRKHFNHVTYDNILLAGQESGIPIPVYIDIIFGKIFINRNTANKLDEYLVGELNIDRDSLMSIMRNKTTLDKIADLLSNVTNSRTLNCVIDMCNDLKEKINEDKNEVCY